MSIQRLFLPILFAGLLFAGCDKDQQVVRQLDGNWNLTKKSFNGIAEDPADYANTTFQFSPCKMNREDCPGFIHNGFSSQPIKYSVNDKGTKIKIVGDGMSSTLEEEGDILEHTATRFVMKTENKFDRITEWELEKIQ